jgi:mRNA interferase RelE/StbE
MAHIVLHRRAARYFERMDERLKEQLRNKLKEMAVDPFKMPGVKPMQGEWKGYYRLRHGDLRVIYTFQEANNTIIVAHIGPRGDVYN